MKREISFRQRLKWSMWCLRRIGQYVSLQLQQLKKSWQQGGRLGVLTVCAHCGSHLVRVTHQETTIQENGEVMCSSQVTCERCQAHSHIVEIWAASNESVPVTVESKTG